MENATKALLMAGGILLGILIISLAVTIFRNTGNVTKTYSATLRQEEITTFNTNFTKYIDKDLTIHEVVTIYNFAESNGVTVNTTVDISKIGEIVKNEQDQSKIQNKKLKNIYKITLPLNAYDSDGLISKINIEYKGLKEIV